MLIQRTQLLKHKRVLALQDGGQLFLVRQVQLVGMLDELAEGLYLQHGLLIVFKHLSDELCVFDT